MRRRYETVIGALGVYVSLMAGCLTPSGKPLGVPELRQAGELTTAEPVTETPKHFPVSEVQPPTPYHYIPPAPLRRSEPPPAPDPEVQQAAAPPLPTPVPLPTPKTEPPPPDPALVAAVRQMLAHHLTEAAQALHQFKPRERELALTLLGLVVRICDEGHRDTVLNEAREALRQRMPLTLGAVCFCSEVRAFGLYKELPPDRHLFQAGVDGLPGEPMQVYIEVRDFYSQPRDGYFETRLAATVFLEDGHETNLAEIHPRTHTDRSLTPRQDYFIVLTIPVPERLPAGSYILKLELRDETPPPPGFPVTQRFAKRTLDFRVVERGSQHATRSTQMD